MKDLTSTRVPMQLEFSEFQEDWPDYPFGPEPADATDSAVRLAEVDAKIRPLRTRVDPTRKHR